MKEQNLTEQAKEYVADIINCQAELDKCVLGGLYFLVAFKVFFADSVRWYIVSRRLSDSIDSKLLFPLIDRSNTHSFSLLCCLWGMDYHI